MSKIQQFVGIWFRVLFETNFDLTNPNQSASVRLAKVSSFKKKSQNFTILNKKQKEAISCGYLQVLLMILICES